MKIVLAWFATYRDIHVNWHVPLYKPSLVHCPSVTCLVFRWTVIPKLDSFWITNNSGCHLKTGDQNVQLSDILGFWGPVFGSPYNKFREFLFVPVKEQSLFTVSVTFRLNLQWPMFSSHSLSLSKKLCRQKTEYTHTQEINRIAVSQLQDDSFEFFCYWWVLARLSGKRNLSTSAPLKGQSLILFFPFYSSIYRVPLLLAFTTHQ